MAAVRVLRDTAVVFADETAAALRSRVSIVIGLVQPVLYLAFFGPVLTRVIGDGGPAAWRVYLPGLLVQLALFAAGFAGFSLIPDMRSGYLQRVRATPASRTALLLGRALRDAVLLLVQGAVIVVAGVVAGLRAPLPGVLAGFALLGLFSLALSCVSYTMALSLPDEYAFAPAINSLVLPVMLLSGILLPLTYAPGWLRSLAAVNPARYEVDALRDLYAGRYVSPAVVTALAVAAGCLVVTAAAARRSLDRYGG